jgi:hypothetical protein
MSLVPIKITVRKGDPQNGEPVMKYPKGHNPKIIDQSGIGMHYGKTQQIGKGATEEYALTAVPQWYLDEYIKDAKKAGEEDLIEVLTEEQAEEFFAQHVPEPDEIIDDKEKIDLLIIKKQLGVELTKEEMKAINPDDNTSGIIKNPKKGFRAKL